MLTYGPDFDYSCPNCALTLTLEMCEPHPTRADVELRNFRCATCGPVKTVAISLRPGTSPPELAA